MDQMKSELILGGLFLALTAPLRVQTRDLAGNNPHFARSCQPDAGDRQQTQRDGQPDGQRIAPRPIVERAGSREERAQRVLVQRVSFHDVQSSMAATRIAALPRARDSDPLYSKQSREVILKGAERSEESLC